MGKRNKILAGILALALFGPLGPSPAPTPVYAAGVSGVGFAEETLTVSSTALSITANLCVVRGRQTPALLEVLDNAIFFTLDSPSATPDSGDYAAAVGTVIAVERANYIRMIRQSVDTSVKVTCFRAGQLPTETSFDKSGAGIAAGGGTVLQASSIDDTDTHATGTTVVVNMGAVAVPTDTAVSANDIGMVAMSLDRRALGDVDIAIDGTSVTGGAGAVAAGTPRVTLGSDDPAVVDLASIQTATEATQAAVEIMDDWDETNRAAVNLIASQVGIAGGSGVLGATVPRVTIATDDEVNDDLDNIRIATQLSDDVVYLEDVLSSTGEAGVGVLFVRNDNAATSLTSTNLDRGTPAIDNRGVQFVQGRFREDDGAANNDFGQVALSLRADVLAAGAGVTADNDFTYRRVDNHGSGWAALTADDGARIPADSTTGLKITSGSAATDLGKVDDVAHVAADIGVMALGVANNTVAALTDTNADYTPRGLTSSGAGLSVTINDTNVAGSRDTSKAEDDFIGNGGEALVAIATLVDDVLAAGAATSGDGSATLLRVDNFGSGWAALTADDGARIPADATAGLKVDLGADNDVTLSSTADITIQIADVDALGGSGVITAQVQRVTLATDDELNDDADAIRVAVEIMDDWDETNRAAVNTIAGQVGVQGAAGAVTALTQRVTITTDDEINDDLDAIRIAVETLSIRAKINCTANAFLNMTTATTTEIVAISASTDIYVCSYSLVTDGAVATNVTFVSGTGTNCATGQAARSSALPLSAAADTVGIARGSGEGMIIKSDAGGDALCVTSSGAAVLGIDISYAQF